LFVAGAAVACPGGVNPGQGAGSILGFRWVDIWDMLDRRDIVDIRGVGAPPGPEESVRRGDDVAAGIVTDAGGKSRAFLGVWFRCCHVYGRMYKTDDGTRYLGSCPKCGASVKACVGEGGTSRRIFEAG
jgi:hypothetical protein